MMRTSTQEIASGIHRLSTRVDDAVGGYTFHQFLILADEPLLFRTGPRSLFASTSEAIGRILPLADLRWITFGELDSEDCGAMNELLAAAPRARVAHGLTSTASLEDLCIWPPHTLGEGEVMDLGGKRVRHVGSHRSGSHEASVLFEETTRMLFSGDLFAYLGDGPPRPHVRYDESLLRLADAFAVLARAS